MKHIAVITTYPEDGTQNIGDQLITDSLISMLNEIDKNIRITSFWREAPFEQIKHILHECDVIIFACLAIRPDFARKEYPYIKDIISLKKPIYIVSAGTALDVSSISNLDDYLSDDSKYVLKILDEKSQHFGVRGMLSYKYLKDLGMKNIELTGDIAFYSPLYRNKSFCVPDTVKNIVISDPHRGVAYKNAFVELISQIRTIFPKANLTVALHGKNEIISELCKSYDVPCKAIYEDKNAGLKIYDEADMHVGFRVHAHVSTLKRRKVSYLLEQDGRGCDYGLTLPVKISVPCYQKLFANYNIKFFKDIITYRSKYTLKQASINDVKILAALIFSDFEQGFEKFSQLTSPIDDFCIKISQALDNV
ncbi:polysaccharide pyruvyl transferase family protein [Vibrio furnissii]|uniref:polysaccharide pyruvyl transferase family protein n=1 Tax=Vibrio furnissii TaxID=29494 RepID=UPI0037530ADB